MKKQRNRWVMLAAHFCVNLVLGGVYAFSFFKTPLLQQFNWDPTGLSLAFSINMGIIPIPMILGGKMIDKGKGKQAILIGGVLFSLGFILSGFVTTLPMLLLTYGVLAGFGSGMCFTGTLNNIMKFFPDKRGLASGVVLSGVGLGTLLCTEIARNILQRTTITNSLLILGLIYITVFFIVSFFIESAPAKGDVGNLKTPIDKEPQEMLKDKRYYILTATLAMGAFSGMIISSSSSQIGASMFGLTSGALIVSGVSIFNSIGRLIWGAISDRLGDYNTLRLVNGILALLMVLLLIANGNPALFYISAFGVGFSYAGILTIFPGVTSRNFGLQNQGINYGFIYIGFSLASIFAPILSSKIAEMYNGDYSIAFIVALVLSLIGILTLTVMKKLTAEYRKKVGMES